MCKSYSHSTIVIVFIWSIVAFLCVQCRSPSGTPDDESGLTGKMEPCLRRCGLRNRTDDAKSASREGLRGRHRSCYKQCRVSERKRYLRSRLNKQKQSLDQQTKTFFMREKREIASNQTNETSPFTNEAGRCFIEPKADNDTSFQPNNVSLTFEELNSSGIYEGEISWKPYSGDALNWTEYRIIYSIEDLTSKKFGVNCQDLRKNFMSYTIPFKLQREWEINVLVALLPYPTGYDYSVSTCIVSGGEYCLSSGGVETKPPSTMKAMKASSTSATRTSSTTSATKTSTSTPGVETRFSRTVTTPGNKKANAIIVGTVVATVVGAAVLVCGIVVVCQVWRCHRRSQTDEALPPSMSDQEFEYDAFVIFSSKDTDWVKKTLIPTLEKKHGLKCCIHYRNFTPGVLFRDNVVESVYKCRKTVAVVSSHFFDSNYCGSELDFALHRLMEKRDDSLVVIKLDEVDKENLPIELQERSYIDYSKSVERKEWEKKLVNCLKKKAEKQIKCKSVA